MIGGPRIARVELNVDERMRLAELIESRDEQLVGKKCRCAHAQRLAAIVPGELRQCAIESIE